MVLNNRGMSMAIQIFIVLFVLLAVAMLVLRLVAEQTEEQTRTISAVLMEQKLKQIKADCMNSCKCDSLREKVGYCLTLIKKGKSDEGKLDLDGDGFTTSYVEPPETGGLYGLCEDRIYCSQFAACRCGGQELDMRNCFKLMCTLWMQQEVEWENLMAKFFPEPTCDMTDEERMSHWSFVYADKMVCGE